MHSSITLARASALLLVAALSASAQTVRLPSALPLFVAQGGDTPTVNAHMLVPYQRYGVDFVVVGGAANRELSRGTGAQLEDYFCWGTPVLSPVSGTVIEIVDSLPDNAIGMHDTLRPLGNHVILKSGERYYYLAHFQRGSASVRSGAAVNAGEPVARCGNSGNSDFPHIHLHATGSPRVGEGIGLNLHFGPMHVSLAGEEFEGVQWPLLRGLWLSQP